MKRTIGAALAALAASGAFSATVAQSHDRRVDVAATADAASYEADDHMAPTVPSGTDIPVTLDEDIPVTRDNIGDTFRGHITRDVRVDRRVALVADAPVQVKLVERSDGAKEATVRLVKVNVNGDMRGVKTDVAKADADDAGMSTRPA